MMFIYAKKYEIPAKHVKKIQYQQYQLCMGSPNTKILQLD